MDTLQLEAIATELRANPANEAAVAAAETAISQQSGDELLQAILKQEEKQVEHHAAVANAMTLFETLIEDSPRLGEYLMLRLYPISLLAYRHDVADAIGLWITSRGSPELAEMLQRVSFRESNESIRREYLEWAREMTKEATSREVHHPHGRKG